MTYDEFMTALPYLINEAERLLSVCRNNAQQAYRSLRERTARLKFSHGSELPLGYVSPNPIADKLPCGPRRGRLTRFPPREGPAEWTYHFNGAGLIEGAVCARRGRERVYCVFRDFDEYTWCVAYDASGSIADVRAWGARHFDVDGGAPRTGISFEIAFGADAGEGRGFGPCAMCDVWLFTCEGFSITRFERFTTEAYPELARSFCRDMGMTLYPEDCVRNIYTLEALHESGLVSYAAYTAQPGRSDAKAAGAIMLRRPSSPYPWEPSIL